MTPSRMVTDMVYPMSILCGWFPLSNRWESNHRRWTAAFAIVAAGTSLLTMRLHTETGVFPEFRQAGLWLRENAPQNAMLAGGFPHMEYLSQLESADPPLPASEQRKHPDIAWKKEMTSFGEWMEWQTRTGRPVYFVMPSGKEHPRGFKEVFSNRRVSIVRGSRP